MLLVSKVRAGGHLYYLETAGGRDGQGVEPPGYWLGSGPGSGAGSGPGSGPGPAALRGPVESETLEALLAGVDPRTGRDLGADRRRVRVAGFDLTFCAPKSVSLLHALGEAEVSQAVRAGHERAVAAAMGYVEDRALAVRREVPDVGRVPVAVEAPPPAAFVHRTSRALDPHLHTHVVLANLGRGPEGAWSALDGRGVFAHRGAADALYHAQLRHELTAALGVAWEPVHGGRADVMGVGEEARRAFSRRSAQIAAHLAARGLVPGAGGPPSARASEVAGFATRAPKDVAVSVEELCPEWRRRAMEVGLGPRRLEAALGRVALPGRGCLGDRDPGIALEVVDPGRDGGAERVLATAMAEAMDGVGLSPSVRSFTRRHAIRAWAATRALGEPASAVQARVDRFLSSAFTVEVGANGAQRDGPGVAESRHLLDGRAVERDGGRRSQERETERRLLEELLSRRGMTLDNGRGRDPGRDVGIGLDR